MTIFLSLFLRVLAFCTNTAFFAVSLTLFAFALMVPLAEFMISVNAWPNSWLRDSYIPMNAMEQLAYSLKSIMLGIAFYVIGGQIESWSKKLPSLDDALS